MNRFLAFLAVILMGCATGSLTQRMAQVREGMSEGELTELLGKPKAITNQGALRTFDYTFTEGGATTSYYVIVGQDGIVRSSGRN
jgi:outer membrane protein assembly factor BamE (lipoprotein component of BamABCDE complex)